MMDNRDYYDVLGLTQDSSPSRIKKKYYNLALKWHPDKHDNKREANHKFNEISEAYSILIDPKRKEVYDKYGHEGLRRLENNENPDQNHGINTFLKKGFCGTDKSAFEFLWDILKEESHHDSNTNIREEQAFNPFENYTGEPSETFGFNFEDFGHENDDTGIFELFESSSVDNVELLNPFFMTFEIQQENPEENKGVYFEAPEEKRQTSDVYTFMRSPTRNDFNLDGYLHEEGSDSDELSIDSLASKLHEFQSSLNHFHRKLEDNINPGACLSPNSKKISKPEKFTPSYFQKRNHLYNPMQSTFIN